MSALAALLSAWRLRCSPSDARSYHRPLLALVPALTLGIVAGATWPGHRWAAIVVSLSSVGWAMVCRHRQQSMQIAPLLLWGAVGYLLIQPWLAPHLPPGDVSEYANGEVWEVTGQVVSSPQHHGRRMRARVRVFTVEAKATDRERSARGDLRLTWASDQGPLRSGDRIRFVGRLRRLHSFHNPGGFDYARHMAFQGLRVSAYARRGTLEVLTPAPPTSPWLAMLRARLAEVSTVVDRVGSAGARPAVKPLLETLLLGRRQGLTADLRQPYNRCGVAHLLAISGLHLGAVGGVAFMGFGVLLAFVPALRWRGWVGRSAALLALGPVLAYALLAGLPVSTQRAAVMLAVLMAAILFQRRSDSFNNLALAALVVLSGHPPALFSISFQLSFAAVAAILYGLELCRGWWRQGAPGPFRLRHRMRLLVLVSTLAFVGTAPLVAHYFNTLSLVALPANLLLVPWVSMLILPAGLLGLLLALCGLPGAQLLLHWCALNLGAVDALVNRVSGWPWAAVDTITPSLVELLLGYGLLVLLPWVLASRWARRTAVLLTVLLCIDAAYWGYLRFWSPRLRVTAIDVGQGGSTLVELPGGKTLLIDGGGFSDNRVFDVGQRVLTPLLGRKKIRTLDLVVLTHPNSDHLNGLLYLLAHFRVGTFWRNADTPDTVGFAELQRRLVREKIPHPPYDELPSALQLGPVLVELLHPPRDYGVDGRSQKPNTNDNSLVLKLTHGAHSFLWSGDLERRAESAIIARLAPERLRATILFAPHHGSRSSNTPAWVAAVAPQEVVFSVGWQNPYGFPHAEVTARYRSHGARLWRTDRHGAVAFTSDGRRLSIRSSLSPDSAVLPSP